MTVEREGSGEDEREANQYAALCVVHWELFSGAGFVLAVYKRRATSVTHRELLACADD